MQESSRRPLTLHVSNPQLESRDMPELWEPIVGFEGYFSVSNQGRVRSETRTVPHKRHGTVTYTGKMLEPTLHVHGESSYYVISLSKHGRAKTLPVHRAVADAFLCNPDGHEVVDHIDGDCTNNKAENLEWVSRSESAQRNVARGKLKGHRGERNPLSILMEEDVREIRRLLAEGGMTQRRIAELFGVVPMVITDIKMGRLWSHVE